jgi:hypothetical protein
VREPSLLAGEEVVLQAQGSFQEGRYGLPWQLGYLYLTNNRLFFVQVTKRVFEVGLDEITGLKVVKRGWLLGVRINQIGVSFVSGGSKRTAFIGLERPERWMEAIKEGMTLALVGRR